MLSRTSSRVRPPEPERMYDGRSANLVASREGAQVGSVDLLRDGVVSRGVLADVAAVKGRRLESGEGPCPRISKRRSTRSRCSELRARRRAGSHADSRPDPDADGELRLRRVLDALERRALELLRRHFAHDTDGDGRADPERDAYGRR